MINNINKIKELSKQGLITPEGQKAFDLRTENKSRIYAHEKKSVHLDISYEKQFKANKIAWNYFQTLAPSYRKSSKNWVMSAKQETTKVKRLTALIADSQAGTNQWKENKYNKK